MVGMILKRTDLSSFFKDFDILAVDEEAPRFLVSKIGSHYLDEIHLVEVSNEHEAFITSSHITSEIFVKKRSNNDRNSD